MANKKGDDNRSVRATKRKIQEAMMLLLKTKSAEKISVRELTELADVNRGTFYLHYVDIYDLLEQMENQAIDELIAFLPAQLPQDLDSSIHEIIGQVTAFYFENQARFILLLGSNGRKNVQRRISDLLVERIVACARQIPHGVPPEILELSVRFWVEGTIGLFEYQFIQGNPADRDIYMKLLAENAKTYFHQYSGDQPLTDG